MTVDATAQPLLDARRLIEGGFHRVGRWSRDVSGALALDGTAPPIPGVYAFAIDGQVHYVGVASRNLAQRLYFYAKPGPSQPTNIRLNQLLKDTLARGAEVEVYIACPPALEWNGWPISAAEGLEAALIRDHHLPWNKRGATKPGRADTPTAVSPSQIIGQTWWVYENWTHRRARIHRGECGHCNHGHGAQVGASIKNGRWIGPFADRSKAAAAADRLKHRDTSTCAACGA
jgi:hypothetical protein